MTAKHTANLTDDSSSATTPNAEHVFTAGPLADGIGSFFTLYASGTWDSGTLALFASPDDGVTWFPITDATLTDDGYLNVQMVATQFGYTLDGTTSPDLNIVIP